jgi:urease accessory protein
MPTKSAVFRNGLASVLAAVPTLALAHTGAGSSIDFMHGFAHPISGVDHVLAMVAVGIFAANLGGRALWGVPLTFMALLAVGGAAGIMEMPLPHVELGIALSIVALGLAIAVRFEWPVAVAMTLVGVFAIFHGHAHGTETPMAGSAIGYALGFVTATGSLHLSGLVFGIGIAAGGFRYSGRITQASGAALAMAGVLLLSDAV